MKKRQPNRLPSYGVLTNTRSTKIDDRLAKELEKEAKRLKRSESDIIRNALRAYFKIDDEVTA